MGLGTYGALAGLGQGMVANAKQKYEDQTIEKQARIDEARDVRLAHLKSRLDSEARVQEHENRVAEIGVQGGVQVAVNTADANLDATVRQPAVTAGAVEVRGADNAAALTRQNDDQEFEGEEREADRQSAERIAGMRGAGSSSAAELEFLERFERVSQTVAGETSQGIPTESQVNTIYDKETQNTYVQQGERFVLQGTNPRPAPPAAIDALMQAPDMATDFIEKYGFLPARFVQTLPTQRSK